MTKRGQMQLSFGMIFSIILIIVFLSFAFFAIKKIIGIGSSAQIAKFEESFQADIDKLWVASRGSQQEEYFLSDKITQVCFVDYFADERGTNQDLYDELQQFYFGSENMFFYPSSASQGFESAVINHIDLSTIIARENPYCIATSDGKVKFTLKKDFDETLVTISR